jgi:hypothetical protein
MKIKTAALAAGASATLGLAVLGTSAASAAAVPADYIHEIQYSPAGRDTPVTTAKLNGEWVLLTNTTGRSATMTAWTLRDAQSTARGHIYHFPKFVLKAHKSVTVHTGTGKNSATNLYWGHKPTASTAYVWNNSGRETATLRNAAGKQIDKRSYTGKSTGSRASDVIFPK